MTLQGKKIVLGICGGIAAYKTPDLVRKLTAEGAQVRVVLNQSASHFVSELALQAVSGFPVSTDLLDPSAEAAMGHIELAKWADVLLIAPVTANTMAKLAHGIADDLLTTLYLATTAQVCLAPAMNQQMWKAKPTQHNLSLLQNYGIHLLGPADGAQACGDIGPGRMLEPEDIVKSLSSLCNPVQPLAGKRLLITAGPTRECLDPVRFISNHSSGKMGFAIAEQARNQGAEVTLVTGPVALTTPKGVQRINVESAAQMLDAVMAEVNQHDIFVATAAVADYRAQAVADNKIKKNDDELTLTFVKNPDILKTVAGLPKPPFCVGFAAESQDVEAYAKRKLADKKLDMIAANDITIAGLGFNSDANALNVFWPGGRQDLPAQPKLALAVALLNLISERYQEKQDTQSL
ncbi:bifunctional phosphopantothenoylcysteine decarboxylase/phosphopantothenate--cysteine ligase CoaBC [Alteromonas lipolytica]|uniref:Coenzyme A biosynthesis bifunctional protein CoaBC n=1 Tax=Alteromonas lipolytica TaxID=1856405 RepID=A0A1E8FHL1_9ALTE|nr:bifunctional phosphopantothenoylcysteine decarboxylase/phosphopantothenate--cysteine ligase CoaBC [Alteromonas lipolytica]OFI35399.1 phosphopantothenoylcysteine decarboxylase [Alteromonas lipolytica]GGF75975.1 bifunctional 4'-phosphopantothenoylcysteine decarboxylase/phosphopantothenoylcysteine synthetase [Alteromonas lipolytica]